MSRIKTSPFTPHELKVLRKALVAEMEMSEQEQIEFSRVKNRTAVARKQKDIDACGVLIQALLPLETAK